MTLTWSHMGAVSQPTLTEARWWTSASSSYSIVMYAVASQPDVCETHQISHEPE